MEEAQSFLGMAEEKIYDPMLLADVNKAIARIGRAIENGERIIVYGDYDVDGMTSSALLALWLRSKGADCEIYIPGRFEEGYGLNCPALDALKARGTQLVITVDCGVTAITEAEHARSIGLDLVITDHHECRAEFPKANAIVDPKRPDCRYPNKHLAGVGVVFKLICAFEGENKTEEMFDLYGDLVAIGTISDVMPVVDENRELIRRGLRAINSNPRPGIRKLIDEVSPDCTKVTAAIVGFTIAPRLNAAGRMGQTDMSVNLLMTQDVSEAEMLASELSRLNTERKKLEAEMFEDAISLLPETHPEGPIVIARRGWYQGVTGIVAARIAERFLYPAIIISIDEDGVGRGSCRSFGSFGIYAALESCEDILHTFGGHEKAAGVTIAEENIEELRRRVTKYYRDKDKTTPAQNLKVDFIVEKPELLELENIEDLELLEPFGHGNPEPILCVTDAYITAVQSIGAGKHTRIRAEKSGRVFDCVYFSMPIEEIGVKEEMHVDVAFVPGVNEFRGRRSVQLLIEDIRSAEKNAECGMRNAE